MKLIWRSSFGDAVERDGCMHLVNCMCVVIKRACTKYIQIQIQYNTNTNTDATRRLHVCGNPNGMRQIHTITNTIQYNTDTNTDTTRQLHVCGNPDGMRHTASPSAPLVKTFLGQCYARYVSILS